MPSLTNSDFADGRILWELLREVATWVSQSRQLDEIDFAGVIHLKPYAVALTVALAKRLGGAGLRVVPPNNNDARDHLIRLGVPGLLGTDWGTAAVRPSNVPLEHLTDRPSSDFSYRVASLLAMEFPGGLPAGMMARIADSIDEVILNALAHGASPIGCVVVGQAFPASYQIEMTCVDFGVTIRGHLGRRMTGLTTDEQAIKEAVKEGVTGTPPGQVNGLGDPNSGVGLSELKEFVESTSGELAILSGSALVTFGTQMRTQLLLGQAFPGTLVNVRFDVSPGKASPRPQGVVYY